MSRPRFATLMFSFLLCTAAHAASTIKLVKEGKTILLPNVASTRFVPNEGPPRIFLLFTDVKAQIPLADVFGEAMMSVSRWAESNKAHAVQVSFDLGDEANYSLNIYGEGMMSGGGGYRSGGDVKGVFKQLTVTDARITGEVKSEEQDGALSGTFDVQPQMVHEAPAIRGAAVAKSPQAIALLGFTRAMKKFDLKAAQPFSARDLQTQFAEARKMLGEKDAKAMAVEMIGDPRKLEKLLSSAGASLLESGDEAKIRVSETISDASGHGSTTQTYSLKKIAGKWKVD